MDLSKVFSLITPLMLLSLAGVIMILYGFVDRNRENNVLQFFFGIPIAAGAIGLHFLVRRLAHQNTLHVWVIEAILVAFMWYIFQRS
ncbi:hypothetical protein EXU85_06995 [Spirosoma sp. KCTC 42546]|uniref:hypothetical protein n=1 Tax=Spirosoma sp. KCTC 42546 TaxID=2520506 RepID=UPI001159BDB8|nr:hypothetical protein [Spirosoma sp. KCTC 42546]QDK78361.1 hypothetical protein EXU85_06995 [Spirosoma sp. KCTC 42546]